MSTKNYAYINHEMLVWARSETPFDTIEDVTLHITGIKPENISSWEKGIEMPSISEAKKLANLYKVPFACFYLSSVPEKKTKPYTDRRTYRGTIYSEISYELWCEICRITGNREIMIDLSDDDFVSIDLPVIKNGLSEKEIADIISRYLKLKLPFKNKSEFKNNGFSYYRAMVEHFGIMVAQITGVSIEEMRGMSIYNDKIPIIAINNKDFERAKVFSLLHEFVHLVRRSSSLCLIDFDERNDDEEKICDRIAAEILMPEGNFGQVVTNVFAIYNEWSSLCLIDIANKFAVSTFSVIRRLYELKIISKLEYYSIYNRSNNEFLSEQERIKREQEDKEFRIKYYITYLNKEGYLFPKKVVSAYNRGDISYGEMCKTLNVKSKHIETIERAVMFI